MVSFDPKQQPQQPVAQPGTALPLLSTALATTLRSAASEALADLKRDGGSIMDALSAPISMRDMLARQTETYRQQELKFRKGAEGEDVRLVWTALNEAAGNTRYESKNRVDAEFMSAVGRYQARRGLTPDGVIGPTTLAAIGADLKKAPEAELAGAISTLEALGRWNTIGNDSHHIKQGPGVTALRVALNKAMPSLCLNETVDRVDPALMKAVRRFQERHFLQEDGLAGSNTLGAVIEELKRQGDPAGSAAAANLADAAPTGAHASLAADLLERLPAEQRRRLVAKVNYGASNSSDITAALAEHLQRYGIEGDAATRSRPQSVLNRFNVEWYRERLSERGQSLDDRPGQVTGIGLRGFDLDGGSHNNPFGAYNDTICFIRRAPSGGYVCEEFRATTDPGLKTSDRYGEDVNRDGKNDIAWLAPGRYTFGHTLHNGHAAAGPLGDVPVYRDTNHNGRIDERDARDTGTALNIHAGSSRAAVGGSSAGCQVIQGGWDEYERRIIPILSADRSGRFPYVLVDLSLSPASAQPQFAAADSAERRNRRG